MSIQSISLEKQLVYVHAKEKPLDKTQFGAEKKADPLDKTHKAARYTLFDITQAAKNLDIQPIEAKPFEIKRHLTDLRNPLGVEIFAAILLKDPFLACHLQYQDSKNRLIVARPLRELGAYVRSRKLPSLKLIARAIKALALGIFRQHLCDSILIQVENSIFHNQKGRLEICTNEKLKKDHPYLFQSALHYEFIPDRSLTKTQIKTRQINAQSFDWLCERWCNIALKLAKKRNTLSNLLKSKQLKMVKKVAMT